MASRTVCCLLGNSSKLCQKSATPLSIAVRGEAFWKTGEQVTHTGQVEPAKNIRPYHTCFHFCTKKFESDDKQLVRFTNRRKEVNPHWAIDLIAEVPPTETKDRIVSCDGGGGPLGHPKVYINLDKPGNHSCGYCGLRFHKEDHHH